MTTKTLYYPVWIAAGGHKTIRRGPDADSPRQPAEIIREKLAKGFASLGVVIEVARDGSRRAMQTYIWPVDARKIINHYEDILDSLEAPE